MSKIIDANNLGVNESVSALNLHITLHNTPSRESLYNLWRRQALGNIKTMPTALLLGTGKETETANVPRCFKKLVLIVAWVAKWHSLTTSSGPSRREWRYYNYLSQSVHCCVTIPNYNAQSFLSFRDTSSAISCGNTRRLYTCREREIV